MQQSSATTSLHLSFWGLRKIVACSHSSSQCLLVSAVFGTVSSLHPTSFLMIFILVIYVSPYFCVELYSYQTSTSSTTLWKLYYCPLYSSLMQMWLGVILMRSLRQCLLWTPTTLPRSNNRDSDDTVRLCMCARVCTCVREAYLFFCRISLCIAQILKMEESHACKFLSLCAIIHAASILPSLSPALHAHKLAGCPITIV